MKKYLWKSICADLKSSNGNIDWKIGEWQKEKNIYLYHKGFHASERIIDAMSFVDCEILAKVEVRGKSIKDKDKQVWGEMKIVKAYHWKKEDSVRLAIFSAELCLNNFEKVFPNDKRPREAIEATKRWLKNPTEKNMSAARSAARSAESAASAARSAAWLAERSVASAASAARSAASAASAARSVAWLAERSAEWSAAWSAARSAARSVASAESAERSAESVERSVASVERSVAWSAAWSAESAESILNKIDKYLLKEVKSLEIYE